MKNGDTALIKGKKNKKNLELNQIICGYCKSHEQYKILKCFASQEKK